jgi:hypothetical protein
MQRYPLGLAFIVVLLLGCTEAPRQSVELSNTVGRDILEVQRAHRELAVRYFDRIKSDINNFVDTKYRTYLIQSTIKDPQFRFMDRFQASLRPDARVDAVSFMEVYSGTVIRRIEDFRKEMLAPVIKQEQRFLAELDDAYQRINAGNATVTAYLASVIKVSDAQNQALATLGAPNLRQQFVDSTVTFSDQVGVLVQNGQQIDSAAGNAQAAFDNLVTQIKAAADAFEKPSFAPKP